MKLEIIFRQRAEMGSLLSNRGIKFLFYMIDFYTKYAWIELLNNKKANLFFMDLLKQQTNLKVNQKK